MGALNKQALLRYRIINERISQGSYPSMDELIEACEDKIGVRFSPETIQKDIKAMKEDEILGYHAPIYFNRQYRGYEYLEKDYTIEKISLNDDEFGVLENIIDILKQFKGSSLGDSFNSAVDKISTSIRSNMEARRNNIISLEPQSEYTNIKDIELFISYIKEHIPLSVINASATVFEGDIIHPYMLKEYHNRWYVVAYSELYDEIKVFDIRYIYDIYKLTKRKFIFKDFDENVFFKHSIGVGIQHKLLVETQIEFNKELHNEINSIPLHPSQQIVKYRKNGNFVIELKIYITNEFFNEVLSFGASAKILKPKWVVGMMKCYIQSMDKLYDISEDECSKKYKITNSK
jgi:predicted DNA-binding transcriptional regulator YafY